MNVFIITAFTRDTKECSTKHCGNELLEEFLMSVTADVTVIAFSARDKALDP